MRPFDICVLSRFPEIFEGFRECVDRDAPEAREIVGWDSQTESRPKLPAPWLWFESPNPFKIAEAANLAWVFAKKDRDVLYAGDDTRIIEPDTCKRLQAAAYSRPDIGIVSARIGAPQPLQPVFTPLGFVAFVFVYIKREVIDKIGYLDERFEGYGVEDADYCYRARRAGFQVGFANHVAIQHGITGRPTETFRRVKTEQEIWQEDAENWKRFEAKWGITKAQWIKETF